MVLSTIAFTGMNGLLKLLTTYSAYQLVFFRALGSLFFTFGYLLSKGIPIFGKNKKLLITRGVFGSTSMLLFFMAVHYMPIGSAVALRYIAPIFATVFAVFMLKERVRPVQWLFFILSFVGVLVLKGFDDKVPTFGLILVLLASVFSGLVYIVIRKIGTSEHPVVIVNYFLCIAVIVGGLLSILDWKTPNLTDLMLLLCLGVFGYFGQIFMTKAFQIGEINIIAPIKYIEVVFVIIVGVGFLGETYSIWSLIGIVMIIAGLLLNLVFKQWSEKRNKSIKEKLL